MKKTGNIKSPLARLKRYGCKKALVFSLIPLALLLVTSTVLISSLEKRGLIDTVRFDDRIHCAPVNFLKIEDGQYVIDEKSMIRTTFPVKKAKNTFRIIMTGGSFAMGSPYNTQSSAPENLRGGIPNWLQAELQARYSSIKFETINAAAGGQSSLRVKEIVREMVRAEPDLIVVATGNNEGSLPPTNLNVPLHQWNIYRAMKKSLLRSPNLHERPDLGHNEQIPADHIFGLVANVFKIVEIVKKNKIPLILATIPVNLKFNDPRPMNKPLDQAFIQGQKLMKNGDYLHAIEAFEQSGVVPERWRLAAQCHEFLGQFEQARENYFDCFPIPAILSQNVDLRLIGKQQQVIIADLEKAAFDLSPHGITGDSLFLDLCHMNWKGYYLMTQEILRVLHDAKLIPAAPNEPFPKPTMDELIEQNEWSKLYSMTH